MHFAIHSTAPTKVADLKSALQAELDEYLGPEISAEEEELRAGLREAPAGGATATALTKALAALPPLPGVRDPALRKAVRADAAVGIAHVCLLAAEHQDLGDFVVATVSGSTDRVDSEITGRVTIGFDVIDMEAVKARLASAPAQEPLANAGTSSLETAPPTPDAPSIAATKPAS